MTEKSGTIADLAMVLAQARYDLHVYVSRGVYIAVLCRAGESVIAHMACCADMEDAIERVLKNSRPN